MNFPANYFFIDGSALAAQIRQLRREDQSFKNRKLCPTLLTRYFMQMLPDLHSGAYKRVTFYFPIGDEASVDEHLVVPNHSQPGEVRDIHFKYCGQKLKRSAEFAEFVETQVPQKFLSRFSKSEKGIDTEICCDALKLASASRMERLFLLTNDDDFIPLCRTLKEYGANVSLIHLMDTVGKNISLLKETDSYDVVQRDALQGLFLPHLSEPAPDFEPSPSAMKSDAPPSNIKSVGSDPENSEEPTGS